MKLQLRSTKNGLKSNSLKRLALRLSELYGYKVWRTSGVRQDRVQLVYGDLKDKLTQYRFFKANNISALEFTTDGKVANDWIRKGFVVFGRKELNASCGKGIVVFDHESMHEDPMPSESPCPVYTKYKPKKREFRVHVFRDTVVAIVEKKRKADYQGDKKDAKIRNLEHGYVFAQQIELSEPLRKRIEAVAKQACGCCVSDFKGVDIAYNEKQDDVFVIEVNSAPGIEGSNVEKYAQAIRASVVAVATKGKKNV